MRRFFKLVLLVLVLTAVALVSALTAMRLAIHGRQVRVPELAGMAPAEAERAVAAAGLTLGVENRFYSNNVPEGKIVSQAPLAGTVVRSGRRVRVAQSLGPQRMAVPSVVGDTQRAAEIDVRRRGLDAEVAVAKLPPEVPAGQVAAQSPPANASVVAPRVSLLVAAAPDKPAFLMPDLTGRQMQEAVKAIVAAGLRVDTVTSVADPAAQPNTVLRHSPAAGHKVLAGASINLEVAR